MGAPVWGSTKAGRMGHWRNPAAYRSPGVVQSQDSKTYACPPNSGSCHIGVAMEKGQGCAPASADPLLPEWALWATGSQNKLIS